MKYLADPQVQRLLLMLGGVAIAVIACVVPSLAPARTELIGVGMYVVGIGQKAPGHNGP